MSAQHVLGGRSVPGVNQVIRTPSGTTPLPRARLSSGTGNGVTLGDLFVSLPHRFDPRQRGIDTQVGDPGRAFVSPGSAVKPTRQIQPNAASPVKGAA